MRELRLLALSDDGTRLILAADGAEPGDDEELFTLPIDERVRAAARGDARLGQIPDVGNTLPPRVIQARIRAGETPEQVAQASGTRVERILRFAHPVLQERARVAEQAREARVRLSDGTLTAGLDEFMTQRLRLLGGPIDDVDWDAYRGEDGTWVVTAAWRAGEKSGVARWAYDVPARTATPHDAATTDFAEDTRLVRVVPHVPGGAATAVPWTPPGAPVRETQRPDAGPGTTAPEPKTAEPTGTGSPAGTAEPTGTGSPAGTGEPAGEPADPGPAAPAERSRPTDEERAYLDEIAEHDTVVLRGEEAEDPRAVVPAWEDIVFGLRRNP